MIITGEEKAALSYLPDRISTEILKHSALYGGMINEIRLRSDGLISITVLGENIVCNCRASKKECEDTFVRLCRNSVYSYANTIKEGFVTTPEGIRVGICGSAVCDGDTIRSVYGTNSLCIRIPRRIIGAGDVAYETLKSMSFSRGIIVWSKPGIGKTTLLRELIVRLGGGGQPLRVAVVDTRHELGACISNGGLIDVLEGYPRSKGIEIAKRTLSPQVIVCDEIGNDDDIAAIMDAAGCGIPVVASVHAGSRKDLIENESFSRLIKADVFGAYIGLLEQTPGGYKYDVFKIIGQSKKS